MDYGDQWLAHLRQIRHPLIMGEQQNLATKENDMQDHADAIRKQFIDDYAARVKLSPDDQRALWVAHLREIKHPRMEQIPRREPIQGVAQAVATLERERAARATWKEI